MKSSARNQFSGHIRRVEMKQDTCMVTVACGEQLIQAQVNTSMAEQLQPSIGTIAVVMIKAAALMLIDEHEPLFKLSAENQLHGIVTHIEHGAVNHIVTLTVDKNISVSAAITVGSSERLDIKVGQNLTAVFRADDTILGILQGQG